MTPFAATVSASLTILCLTLSAGVPCLAQEDPARVCADRLKTIGKAVLAYEREHGTIPASFTLLHPRYLSEKTLLICPSDPEPRALREGDLPASYHSYWHDGDGGANLLLSPRPRAGATQREVLAAQRLNFGDRVPITQCWRHRLLLAVNGDVHPFGRLWQQDPAVVPSVVACLHRDVHGDWATFDRRWSLAELGKYLNWAREARVRLEERDRTRLREAANAIQQRADAPDGLRHFAAGAAFAVAEEVDRASEALERAILAKDSQHERALKPLEALYQSAKQPERAIRFYRKLLDRYPGSAGYAEKLAGAYLASGQREAAQEWSVKATSAARAVTNTPAVDACKRRLRAVHQALIAYRKEKGEFPPNLSDLVPARLQPEQLHCPSDHSPGAVGTPYAHRDPALYVSYAYELSLEPSRGLAHALGPFPRRSNGWGSCRDVTTHQRTFYGPQVPLVRCFHHRPAEREKYADDQVLNLREDGTVYRSGFRWEHHPESLAIALGRAARDLNAGAEAFTQRWYLGQIDQDASDWIDEPQPPRTRAALAHLASAVEKRARELKPLSEAFALRVACRLYTAGGRSAAAIRVGQQALALLPKTDANGRNAVQNLLGQAYRRAGQYDRAIALYQELHESSPKIGYYMLQLSELHELAGRSEEARAWREKYDPGQTLVGKPAPEFTLPRPSGGQITLTEARRGKRATLINFWFYG